jgi:hypothetical protein
MDDYEFQGISFSCYEIGGDYYDFISQPDGKMLVALGDVSGKGTAAALLMSSLHAAIHAQVAAKTSLYQTVKSVNQYLAENTPSNRFVTLFIAELDTRRAFSNTSTPDTIRRSSDTPTARFSNSRQAAFRSEFCRRRILKSGRRNSNRAKRW